MAKDIQPIEIPSSNSQTQDSTANTAQTLTRAAVPGKCHYITAVEVLISGAAAVNDITIQLQDNSSTVWKEFIGSGATRGERAGIVFLSPIKITQGNPANLVVAAGGASVVTTANMAGFTA